MRVNKHTTEKILTTTSTLEWGYLAYQGNDLSMFDEQIIRLGQSFRLWQERVEDFRKALNADEDVMPMQRDCFMRADTDCRSTHGFTDENPDTLKRTSIPDSPKIPPRSSLLATTHQFNKLQCHL
ncbi:hypothetical protein D5A36_20730 [Salmonella enterica subsp. enterica]|nr:hypothetical protein [Salmonella enterica subsp. enterica serovar Tornow]